MKSSENRKKSGKVVQRIKTVKIARQKTMPSKSVADLDAVSIQTELGLCSAVVRWSCLDESRTAWSKRRGSRPYLTNSDSGSEPVICLTSAVITCLGLGAFNYRTSTAQKRPVCKWAGLKLNMFTTTKTTSSHSKGEKGDPPTPSKVQPW